MSGGTRVHREATLPDATRVARCLRSPELGPRILFFTGGSALRKLSRTLKLYTHNSIHLITPFDSGGSSALIRQAFDMLSVGDLRNRMLALADESVGGNPQIYELFSHRLPTTASASALHDQLSEMVAGTHALVAQVPSPMRRVVQTHLRFFSDRMPRSFDLSGANIGNLILAGGYLANERDIDSVVYLFSKLVEVRGTVRPICDEDLHLCATLEDGTRVAGQHALTGKQQPPIESPVASLSLIDSLVGGEAREARASPEIRELIRSSELLCYPMGSFYSSLLANLLPVGVGRAVTEAICPKVYVPNLGRDPEQLGMTLSSAVERLIEQVRRDAGADLPISDILNFVLVDTERGNYSGRLDLERVKELGVEVLDLPLIDDESTPWIDPESLTKVLLSLA
jgi:CofD-related protein of GAK system